MNALRFQPYTLVLATTLFTLLLGCGSNVSVDVNDSTGQARGAVETTAPLPADACADWDAEVYFSPFDDVVGAISVHLVAGIWGTLCVGIFGAGSVTTQVIGIASIGAFVVVASSIAWFILKATVGIRIDEEDEVRGSDMTECGMEAYPEFGRGSKAM